MNRGVVRAGLEHPPQTSGETQISEVGDAQYDAPAVESVTDDRLQRIIDAWPDLPEAVQNELYRLATD